MANVRKNQRHRKEGRHKEAQVRLEARQNLSTQDVLDLLDQRLGKGLGALKERKRLNGLIEAAKKTSVSNTKKKKGKKNGKEEQKEGT